jgi:hypothetical protein
LTQYAPTWLAQMPALLSVTEIEVVQRKAAGAARERMLRELAEAMEALTVERPLVLWLEDLHWSDYSTLDLVSFLAQRREWARLLVISSYRPVEVLAQGHPLHAVKQELQLHGQCEELRLGLLTENNVAEYLAIQFTGAGEEKPSRDREGAEGRPLADARGSEETLTLARELSHPFSLIYALSCAAFLHRYRREGQATQGWAEAVITLSTEQGYAVWAAYGTFLRGWALAVVDKTGERRYEAELYRLKGELTLQRFQVQGSKFKDEESQ